MPRDVGTGLYHYPDGTPGNTGQTIFSARYNTFINDLSNTLNQPLPVNMGGTGASSGDAALTNLPAEKAAQLVTNYDTQLWMPGSYRSAAAATSAPNSTSSFVGTAYVNEPLVNPPTNQNVVLEARDQNDTTIPGRTYVREKKAGVWGPWTGGIYAAPFDAMAYSGMQVNGSMEVSQELGSSVRSTYGYVCDGWQISSNMAGFTSQGAQYANWVPGIPNLLVCAMASTPTLASSSYMTFLHYIEGYRFSRMAWGTAGAKSLTIAFWAAHSKPGTYSLTVNSGLGNNNYSTTYTHSGGNVIEYKVITIPGCTTGTWKQDNTIALSLNFAQACGATYTAPAANSWNTGYYLAAPGQVNAAVNGDVCRITGVVILPGSQAPTAAQSPLIMRPYDQELVTCQRYLQTLVSATAYLNGQCTAATAAFGVLIYPGGKMRSAPTFTPTAAGSFSTLSATNTAIGLSSAPALLSTSEIDRAFIGWGVSSGLVAGNATALYHATGISRLMLDARL